jgi:DNA-binding FrmR family transcriptional regulator
MELPDETVQQLKGRLRRIEGQVRGIQVMLDEGRECRDVVTQLSAATSALEKTGFQLVAAGLVWCLEHPEESAEDGYGIADVQKMFLSLS